VGFFLTNVQYTIMKTFLHVGCGPKQKDKTTKEFASANWKELRFDIDATVNPDLIGTMTDMSAVGDASVDAIFSSHNIEHLYPHEVPLALKEFSRVLKPDGFAVITCPDLQEVAKLVADDKLLEPAYDSPAGPVAPIDIMYGYRPSMSAGNLYMAHRCGFTQRALTSTVKAFGFTHSASKKRGHPYYDLWIVASVKELGEERLRELANLHFP
jgi:SAM-dependent methyltransferase